VNGTAVKPNYKVKPNDLISIVLAYPPRDTEIYPENIPVNVVYEDEDILVVNKPAGMVFHPGHGNFTGTLLNALAYYYKDTGSTAYLCHRIDKDTSGLLVVTKTDAAREGLKCELLSHRVERVYQAITCGVPTVSEIHTLYARHPTSRLRFTANVDHGKSAVTHLRVIESLAGGHAAHVECRLETGRTHQIRVHLTERAQTPLLADKLYRNHRSGDASLKDAAERIGRQALHAGVLGFEHPIDKRACRFEVPPPEDFVSALEALRLIRAVTPK